MESKILTETFSKFAKKKYKAYFISISNENLYEFTKDELNYVKKLTGFNGDTASLLLTRDRAYLYVDGRFTFEAKSEVKDKRIKIIEVDRHKDMIKDICDRLNANSSLAFNPKLVSIKKVFDVKKEFDNKNIKLVCDEKFLSYGRYINDTGSLFRLKGEYVTDSTKMKIGTLLDEISKDGFTHYLTSSKEEIAYLTNLRKLPIDSMILFDAFMVVSIKKSILYTDCEINKVDLSYLSKNNITVHKRNDFYIELDRLRNCNYALDPKLNNYFIYKSLKLNGTRHFVLSPLSRSMSIKGENEIRSLKKCNILDGVAITKAIYDIKSKVERGEKLSEWDAKNIVDCYRKKVGKKYYLTPSFDTIVAYKENSAMCHYIPRIDKSSTIKKGSLLLIDSGGNYLLGTTDITRTINMYGKNVPKTIKKHYTLILNALVKLAIQKFPYGITGVEMDIVARQYVYNEHIDYGHSTGHGIGYISNVHEGPNRIGPGISKNYDENVLEPNQVVSDEPGLYFEDKYGIRLENDLLIVFDKNTKYGDFLRFETLTLCPFDRDLIDEKMLDADVKSSLNSYNMTVRKKLYRRLNIYERKRLLYDTKMFK